MPIEDVLARLKELGDEERAKVLQRFFKTGPEEYGEGDRFLGIRVPVLRKLAKEYQDIGTSEIKKLLRSSFHEERLLALLILVLKYSKGNGAARKRIYKLYMSHTRFINNWDLADASAEHIAGAFLMDKSKQPVYRFARSDHLWERRISICHREIPRAQTAAILEREDLMFSIRKRRSAACSRPGPFSTSPANPFGLQAHILT